MTLCQEPSRWSRGQEETRTGPTGFRVAVRTVSPVKEQSRIPELAHFQEPSLEAGSVAQWQSSSALDCSPQQQ